MLDKVVWTTDYFWKLLAVAKVNDCYDCFWPFSIFRVVIFESKFFARPNVFVARNRRFEIKPNFNKNMFAWWHAKLGSKELQHTN